jgi:trimeric autotransporter adhesin
MAFSKARRLSDFIAADGTVPATKFATGTITSATLDNDAVTTDKVLDANITHAKLHATMDLTGKTVTVSTASAGDNDTSVASTAFVQQELTTLIGGAPSALDTLNELAAAINDDASYASTLTTALATKLPLAGGALTGALTTNSTIDGRNVSTDGAKLDTVETNADITDTANVTSAGALMDSELTAIASIKALNQGVATTDDPTFTNTKLAAIAQSKSDTAVDVFVYDTSKDSDGGAWRKRTQHTSWYNEASGSTRSSRKEFPSVAVIVAKAYQVTIYDGDDPDLPMWMVWNDISLGGNKTIKSVTALNNIIAWGTNDGSSNSGALYEWNFLAETKYIFGWYGDTYRLDNAFSNRTIDGSIILDNSRGTILQSNVNDVAMTVLPNAPIDADTGLPVPTIAVATHGGTSVITDSGNVYDISGFNPVTSIEFYGSKLAFSTEVSSTTYITVGPSSLSSDISVSNWRDYEGEYNSTGTRGITVLADMADHLAYGNSLYSAGVNGLTAIDHNDSDATLSMGVIINSDYNTGWMHGDIKLATLSDTSTTSTSGPELITNGTTFSDTTGWTGSATTLSVSGGELVLTGTATVNQNQSAYFTPIACAVGDQFLVTFDIAELVQNNASAGIIVGGATIRKNNNAGYWYPGSVGTHSTVVDATSTTFTLYLHAGIPVGVITKFDNISVHKLNEIDRSINNNDLRVIGTMTKSVVATGAELVAYSGFSSSNYLEQPYNTDLDFNSGDFSYCFWSNNPATAAEYIADRAEGNGNYRIALYLSSGDNGTMNFYTRDGSAYTEVSGIIGTPNQWAQIWCIRRGTSHEIWVNGINKVATVGTVRDVSYASGDAVQKIGVRYGNSSGNTGKIALFRVSATAPSAEQIAKIYNDEKHLFQTNVKATLYGTSDAVTALAYDDDTELLHIGTSAGRSVFQGLNRVDNTTDAVGAAISASNGLVAED